jgi:hypothetical protein
MQLELSKKRVQQMAQALRADLPERARPSHAQALDTVARMLGYADFNALKPALDAPSPEPEPVRVIIDYTGGLLQAIEADAPLKVFAIDWDLLKYNVSFDPNPDAEPLTEQIDAQTPGWQGFEASSTDEIRQTASRITGEVREELAKRARWSFGEDAV